MQELFEYFGEEERNRIKTTLGMKIGSVVTKIVKEKGIEPQNFNSIDRMKFAEKFIEEKLGDKFEFDIFKSWYKIIRGFERYELENDIARYMDLKIPQDYFVATTKTSEKKASNSRLRDRYKGIDTLEGIEFLYEENYHREQEILKERPVFNLPITKKQLSYLRRLIKYSHQRLRDEDIELCNSAKEKVEEMGIENLTLELAKEYIDIFVKLEKAYKEQYESETMEIDNSVKVIDLFNYKNS